MFFVKEVLKIAKWTTGSEEYIPGQLPGNQDISSISVPAGAVIAMLGEPSGTSMHAGCQATVAMEIGDKLRETLWVPFVAVILMPEAQTLTDIKLLAQKPEKARDKLMNTNKSTSIFREINMIKLLI